MTGYVANDLPCPVCAYCGPFERGEEEAHLDVCPCCLFSSSFGQRLHPLQTAKDWQQSVLRYRFEWCQQSLWRSQKTLPPAHMGSAVYEKQHVALQIKFECPVCGEPDEMPATDHQICRCCGTQFDYNDSPNIAEELFRADCWRELRAQWLTEGPTYWWATLHPEQVRADWTPEGARAKLAAWEARGQEFGPHGPWVLAKDAARGKRWVMPRTREDLRAELVAALSLSAFRKWLGFFPLDMEIGVPTKTQDCILHHYLCSDLNVGSEQVYVESRYVRIARFGGDAHYSTAFVFQRRLPAWAALISRMPVARAVTRRDIHRRLALSPWQQGIDMLASDPGVTDIRQAEPGILELNSGVKEVNDV